MFNFLKRKKSKAPDLGETEVEMGELIEVLRAKWLDYYSLVRFKDDVSLTEVIEIFAVPAREFIFSRHPKYAAAPSEVVWLMILTAILESGSHPSEEVNRAIQGLSGPTREDV